ncbi:hypothetical protein LR48_Vigan07g084900 [Vigna angularis]|uniref:Uncharacterized protein n=1 Tax=Phaseolus angularis TaxID=3914 RepID=A0A0L9UWA9_PHAAN|nr:hypothetical protein LR48_Vigan07g084900 [Vigna angularis]
MKLEGGVFDSIPAWGLDLASRQPVAEDIDDVEGDMQREAHVAFGFDFESCNGRKMDFPEGARKEGNNSMNPDVATTSDVPNIKIKVPGDGERHDQTPPPVAASHASSSDSVMKLRTLDMGLCWELILRTSVLVFGRAARHGGLDVVVSEVNFVGEALWESGGK